MSRRGRRRPPGTRCHTAALIALVLVAAALFIDAAALHAGAGTSADGQIVDGSDTARLLAPGAAVIAPYANAGYRLERDPTDPEVWQVTVDLEPLESRTAFHLPTRDPAAAAMTPVERLARGLTRDARDQHIATSRILGWIARSIRYDLDRSAPQEPTRVLARRSAYCTGVARLAVALLDAVGIRAREVAGYVVESPDPVRGAPGAGFHRWIEVWVPDRGWV
ncbi:MAG: transglutaminase-like domain-containing protein, partial [Acidobacteriota bacterium]